MQAALNKCKKPGSSGILPRAALKPLSISINKRHNAIRTRILTTQKTVTLSYWKRTIRGPSQHINHFIYTSFHVPECGPRRLGRSGLPTLVFWPPYPAPSPAHDKNIAPSPSNRPRHYAWLLTLHVIVNSFFFRRTQLCVLPFHSNRLWHIGRLLTCTSALFPSCFIVGF